MESKICTMCNVEKELTEFNIITRRGKKCYHAKCKICFKEYYKESNKNSYNKNKEIRLENQKKYTKENKEQISKQRKEFREKNKERLKLEQKEKYNKNKEVYIQKVKEYYINNKEHLLQKKNERFNIRMSTEPIFKLTKNIKTLIKSKIKCNGYTKDSKTNEILGCSYEEFKLHLESKFESWMTWENHGLYNGELNYGWDIDHVIPISNGKTEEEIIKLNHYTNLQPLCSYVNRVIKRDK